MADNKNRNNFWAVSIFLLIRLRSWKSASLQTIICTWLLFSHLDENRSVVHDKAGSVRIRFWNKLFLKLSFSAVTLKWLRIGLYSKSHVWHCQSDSLIDTIDMPWFDYAAFELSSFLFLQYWLIWALLHQ